MMSNKGINEEDVIFITAKINEDTQRIVSETYDFLRKKSNTYGELEKNISCVVAQIRWEDDSVAIWLNRELMKIMKQEESKMPLP